VREPRPIEGARAPLFERLSDANPHSWQSWSSGRVLDYLALKESVRLDLARLLNTRSCLSDALDELVQGTVLGYGLPDFSALGPASSDDRQRLGDAIAQRIAAYEPRLCEVRVTVNPPVGNPTAVAGVIEAALRVGSVYEPVSFQMTMERDAAQAGGAERVSLE